MSVNTFLGPTLQMYHTEIFPVFFVLPYMISYHLMWRRCILCVCLMWRHNYW